MPESNPTIEAATKRICRLAHRIPTETWAHGERWYDAESAWLAEQADTYGVSHEVAVAVFAALSPREQYGRNRALAVRCLANGGLIDGTLKTNVRRANAALVAGTAALPRTGPKVRRFAANLLGDSEAVTVDVWMSRAANLPQPAGEKRYRTVERAFQRAARRLNVEPRTLQAALWFHIRGHKASDGVAVERGQ